MSSIRKDLPSVNAPNFNERLRETLQTYLGHRGHPLDRGVILRDLVESNIIKLRGGFLATGSGNPIAGPGGALGGNAAYEPDLTPPPTPTGFTVGAGISYLFIGCDPQTYSQGNGHLVTRLYGATWTTGDLPVFADATVLTEFQGTVFAHPTNPATTWHLWITWVTRDGVESPTPAGGTNGLVVTSGQDVSSLLDALTGQITQSQLYADLATPIASIAGLTDATSQNAAAIVQEGVDRATAVAAEAQARAAAVAAEAQARATAITQEQQARATAVQAESQARTNEILAVQAEVLADLESADAAVKTLLRSEFAAADTSTLASAKSYAYSKAQTDGAIAAQGTALTASFTAADAATLASAQNFTYSKSTIDAATAATLATLRSEFAAADTSTLASAKSYAYSKAQADSAIATSANTLRAQLTGGSTGTDLNALTSGLLYQERIARVSATDSLAQQLTLLSAGAGEQFDYKSIWYFDSGIEGWSANLTTSTAVTAVGGWLRMTATTGTQTGRMFQSPAALGIGGAKYPQVRLRVRKVGAPTWVGRLYFTTTADSTWNTAKSLLGGAPTYDANNIGLLTFNMPAGWTGATIAQIRFEASTNITAANYFELDWAAIGRPSPGASSAQLSALELATAAADAAEAAERTALAAEVAGKASGEALSALETRVSTAEGVNTSQGASITSLNNSLTTLTGTVNNKADATALNALTTRVTAAEGVNTSQGSSITTLNNNVSTLTTGLAAKADASAVTALDTRVTAAEGVNSTQSSNITTLTNSLNTLTSTVNTKASASALSDLTSRVTAAEGVNTSQGSSITTLNNNVSTTNTNVAAAQTAANDAAALAGSKGKVLVQSTTPATADRLAQNLWIDTTGGANTPKRWSGTAWVAVTDKVATDAAAAAAAAQATANTKADATALNALTTRVTAAEGVNTSQGSSITTLNNNVSTLTTGLAAKADASAVTALDTRVTAAEGVNTSQGSSITSLNSSLTTTNTNVAAAQTAANDAATLAGSKGKVLVQSAAPAVADRLAQNLWIDTTNNANTPKRWNGSTWVAVTDKVATDAAAAAAAAQATANTKANASALDALTTTVTGQGNTITAQGTRLNSLESTVNNGTTGVAATATALNAVTTRVGTVEGQIVSQASAIQTVQSSLGTVGGENLLYNPSFDVESSSAGLADGWQVGANPGATFTLTLPVSWLESAGKAQRIDFTGVTTSAYVDVATQATRRPPVREGEALAVSASFRATVGVVARSYINVYSASGTRLQTISGPTVTTTGVTQVLSCVLPAALANAASARVIFQVHGASTTAQSGFIEWDRAQAERGTTVSGWRDNSRALSAAIQTEASTRATQTGELYAKYTVKVDVAGLISGYGLASTANNAAPTSSFGVRANAFFVAPPAVASATAPSANLYDGYVWLDTSVEPNVTRYRSGSSWVLNAPALPFVVQATPTTVNGVEVPAGVYANDLFVKNGTITNAKIANLAVDDAKIANLSVSKLDAGSLKVGSYISSANYVSGSQGFAVWATGAAEFNNVTVRGAVYATAGYLQGVEVRNSSGAVLLSSGNTLQQNMFGPGGKITGTNASTYIADLAVNTLQIANNAVTVPTSANAENIVTITPEGGYVLFAPTINSQGGMTTILVGVSLFASDASLIFGVRVYRNGAFLKEFESSGNANYFATFVLADVFNGDASYGLFIHKKYSVSFTGFVGQRTLIVSGAKR